MQRLLQLVREPIYTASKLSQILLYKAFPDDNLNTLLELSIDELPQPPSSRSSPGAELHARILPSLVAHANGRPTVEDASDDEETTLLTNRFQRFAISGAPDLFFGGSRFVPYPYVLLRRVLTSTSARTCSFRTRRQNVKHISRQKTSSLHRSSAQNSGLCNL